LCHLEGVDNLGDGALVRRKEGEDVAAPGFRNRVEDV
jgi:hypothetical protein